MSTRPSETFRAAVSRIEKDQLAKKAPIPVIAPMSAEIKKELEPEKVKETWQEKVKRLKEAKEDANL